MCSYVHPHAGKEATSELPLPGLAKAGTYSNSKHDTLSKALPANMYILFGNK